VSAKVKEKKTATPTPKYPSDESDDTSETSDDSDV